LEPQGEGRYCRNDGIFDMLAPRFDLLQRWHQLAKGNYETCDPPVLISLEVERCRRPSGSGINCPASPMNVLSGISSPPAFQKKISNFLAPRPLAEEDWLVYEAGGVAGSLPGAFRARPPALRSAERERYPRSASCPELGDDERHPMRRRAPAGDRGHRAPAGHVVWLSRRKVAK
jgi:hypothetical protein